MPMSRTTNAMLFLSLYTRTYIHTHTMDDTAAKTTILVLTPTDPAALTSRAKSTTAPGKLHVSLCGSFFP